MEGSSLVNRHRSSSDMSTTTTAPVVATASSQTSQTLSTTSPYSSVSALNSTHRHAPLPYTTSTPSPSTSPLQHNVNGLVHHQPPDSLTLTDDPARERHSHQHRQQPSKDNCDRTRTDEEINPRLGKMSSELVGKTVSPFLKEHIPGLYAPIGKGRQYSPPFSNSQIIRKKDTNSKFCYRHRPDSKCRRAADETKMGFIQSVSRPYHFSLRSRAGVPSHPLSCLAT